MDSFEFNKIAGAVLGTALVVFGLHELAGIVYHAETPEKPGFAIEGAEASTGEEAGWGFWRSRWSPEPTDGTGRAGRRTGWRGEADARHANRRAAGSAHVAARRWRRAS